MNSVIPVSQINRRWKLWGRLLEDVDLPACIPFEVKRQQPKPNTVLEPQAEYRTGSAAASQLVAVMSDMGTTKFQDCLSALEKFIVVLKDDTVPLVLHPKAPTVLQVREGGGDVINVHSKDCGRMIGFRRTSATSK